jgi:hypothetical protein
MPSVIASEPALRAAGVIGLWNTDVPASLSILDEGAAALMAGDPALAGLPIPLEIALGRTHPDDRDWVFDRIRRVRQTGGPVSAEFRVLTATGEVRWVLNQGSLAPDETGAMHGCGAYIDTTDHHVPSFWASSPESASADDPLITAADLTLDAHGAIAKTGERRIRHLSDLLLFEIGRALARRMRA